MPPAVAGRADASTFAGARGAPAAARRGEAGYTYASAMIAAAGLAIAAQATSIPAASERLRDAEAELLFRGEAYRRAVASYWEAGPTRALPRELDHLLEDPREDGVRHIRRLYAPPIGGPWTVLRGEDGGVAGVAPSSDAAPRRRAFFPPGLEAFEGAETYADWTFRFEPEAP